jgi:hypothetical protein
MMRMSVPCRSRSVRAITIERRAWENLSAGARCADRAVAHPAYERRHDLRRISALFPQTLHRQAAYSQCPGDERVGYGSHFGVERLIRAAYKACPEREHAVRAGHGTGLLRVD